jgi:putative salt-induced outer membrane protein YdiY
VGRFLIDRSDLQFSVETGVAHVLEQIEGEAREWPALRFAQRYEQRIVSGARLRQQFEWLANPAEEGEFFLNAEGALEFVVTDRLGFINSARNRYAGRPPQGTRPNDLQFSSALTWSF